MAFKTCARSERWGENHRAIFCTRVYNSRDIMQQQDKQGYCSMTLACLVKIDHHVHLF